MARNIEIKAYLPQFDQCQQTAKLLANTNSETIKQEDVFFHTDIGRLKLRIFDEHHGQLIFYQRNNQAGPKASHYEMSTTTEPMQLKTVLASAYPVRGTVKKVRTLYLVGRTRIHLDQVAGLGNFIELEVVMQENDSAEIGVAEANDLMHKLGVKAADLIDCAYILAMQQAPTIGFDRFIKSARSPFQASDVHDLAHNAPVVLKRDFPSYTRLYQQHGWQMFKALDRVYDSSHAQEQLGWTPKYTFAHCLERLASGKKLMRDLAYAIGTKGYHPQRFSDGPYPVEI